MYTLPDRRRKKGGGNNTTPADNKSSLKCKRRQKTSRALLTKKQRLLDTNTSNKWFVRKITDAKLQYKFNPLMIIVKVQWEVELYVKRKY